MLCILDIILTSKYHEVYTCSKANLNGIVSTSRVHFPVTSLSMPLRVAGPFWAKSTFSALKFVPNWCERAYDPRSDVTDDVINERHAGRSLKEGMLHADTRSNLRES